MPTKNNLFKLSYKEGLQDGRKLEANAIVELINRHICFDHIHTGTCDHQGCWALKEIQEKLRNK